MGSRNYEGRWGGDFEGSNGRGKKNRHGREGGDDEWSQGVVEDPYRRPKAEKKSEAVVNVDNLQVVSFDELDPVQQKEIAKEFVDQDMEEAIRRYNEEFKKKKKVDLNNRNNLGLVKEDVVAETVWYEEAYQDLYKTMTGTEEEIREAEERLNEHGIRRKEYSEDDIDNKQKYIDLLRKIAIGGGDSQEIEELKGKVRNRHKTKKVFKGGNGDLPDELKGGETRLKTDGEMPYLYFSREEGFLKDLDTIYGSNKEAGTKRTAYENLRKRGVEGIKRGDADPRIDYVRGKRMVSLLREYLSLSDDDEEEYPNKEELSLLLKDSGFTKMELIDRARRKRVGEKIEVLNNQLVNEENPLAVDNNLVLLLKHYYEERRFKAENERTARLEEIEGRLDNLGIDLVRSDLLKHPELYQQTKLWLLSDDMNGNDLRKGAERIILDVLKLKEKSEKKEVKTIWNQELFDELEAGTSGVNSNREYYSARDKLKKRGFDLDKIATEENEMTKKRLLSAIAVVQSNKPDENFNSVDLAKQELMKYFGSVEEETDENKNINELAEKLIAEKDKEKLLELIASNLSNEEYLKAVWAVRAMVDGDLGGKFKDEKEAREYFAAHVKVDAENSKKPESMEIESDTRNYLNEWLAVKNHLGGVRRSIADIENSLRHNGLDLSGVVDPEVIGRIGEALFVISFDSSSDSFSNKAVAEKFLHQFFVGGEPKKAEGAEAVVEAEKNIEPEIKIIKTERNPMKRLEQLCEYAKWIQVEKILEKIKDDKEKLEKYKLALRASIYQLEHPEAREKTEGRWENYYLPLLKQLGVKEALAMV